MIQLYETMLTRHCTMIVGPTGGGKTVVINTLVKAQTTMGITTKCITLNPKVRTSTVFVHFSLWFARVFAWIRKLTYNKKA